MTALPIPAECYQKDASAAVLLVLVVMLVIGAGCNIVKNGTDPVQGENGLSTLEPHQMVLNVSDLPAGFALKEEKQLNISELDSSLWHAKEGYVVSFTRGPHAAEDSITEVVAVEAVDTISQQIPSFTRYYVKSGAKTVQLPGPVIGEASSAFIVPGRADRGPETFTIIFTRKDVFVVLVMGGPKPDYSVLQPVAEKAAGKIH